MSIFSGQWAIWRRRRTQGGPPRGGIAGVLLAIGAVGIGTFAATPASSLSVLAEPRSSMITFSIVDMVLYAIPFALWMVSSLLSSIFWARGAHALGQLADRLHGSWHWLGTTIAGAMLLAIPYLSPINTVLGQVEGFGVRRDADRDINGYQMDVRPEGGAPFTVEIDDTVFATLKVGDRVSVSYHAWDRAAVSIDVLDGPRLGMGWTSVPNAYLVFGGVPLLCALAYPIGLKLGELRRWRNERKTTS